MWVEALLPELERAAPVDASSQQYGYAPASPDAQSLPAKHKQEVAARGGSKKICQCWVYRLYAGITSTASCNCTYSD